MTEEVTDNDLVGSQLRITARESLEDLGITQDHIRVNGFARQTRITTEDPSNGFRPDTGRIVAYRSPGGAGIRLDGATATAGSEITGHFDSMLVKFTCRGRDFSTAVRRSRRALAEFRIRGIRTNIPFLQAVLANQEFATGNVTTSFIDEHPELLTARESADRGTKLLNFLGHVTVNLPNGPSRGTVNPHLKLPAIDVSQPPPDGSRQRMLEIGPETFAKELRAQQAVAITDTTFRDAHQSLLTTRVRTTDLLQVAPYVARSTPNLLSVEAFIKEATATGIDIFRIFDVLNDVEQMRPAIEAVRNTGTVSMAEVALCYTGNLLDPNEDIYTLEYYLELAQQIVNAGAHILAIKDMAGLPL